MTATLMVVAGCVTVRNLESTVVAHQASAGVGQGLLTPTVQIGPCVGVKVGPRHLLFAAHCLYAGPGGRFHLAFLPGLKTTVLTSEERAVEVVIAATAVYPGFDPVAARAELEVLARPFVAPPSSDKDGANVAPPPRGSLPAPPRLTDLALVMVADPLHPLPSAQLSLTRPSQGSLVLVSGNGCGLSQPRPPGGLLDPARVIGIEGAVLLLAGALAAGPPVPSVETLCDGNDGGPIYSMERGRLAVVGLSLARVLGRLVAARLDDEGDEKVTSWIAARLADPVPPPPPAQVVALRCSQSLALLSDGEPRVYGIDDLRLAVSPTGVLLGSSTRVPVKVQPTSQPDYTVSLALADVCAPRTLCYQGFHRDPITGETQALKLQLENGILSFAHWTATESGAAPQELEATACQAEAVP